MGSERMRRVDEAVRQVLADALAHELKDPRIGFVTVTDVDTSPDLRHSRGFVSGLGALVAMQGVLTALGKDSVMFMAADEFPLPYEYRFFRFDGLISVIPEDLGERTVVFLDCGNIERNPAHDLRQGGPRINIDHH